MMRIEEFGEEGGGGWEDIRIRGLPAKQSPPFTRPSLSVSS